METTIRPEKNTFRAVNRCFRMVQNSSGVQQHFSGAVFMICQPFKG
ncbi:MAG: hypothetical protein JNL03_09065 [Prolixibacteraceae bacterium]|nr:hypothetical protein [Prolixibacteraceae bacterium]